MRRRGVAGSAAGRRGLGEGRPGGHRRLGPAADHHPCACCVRVCVRAALPVRARVPRSRFSSPPGRGPSVQILVKGNVVTGGGACCARSRRAAGTAHLHHLRAQPGELGRVGRGDVEPRQSASSWRDCSRYDLDVS